MISEKFIYISSALYLYGAISYFIDTLKGKIQPNKVTWFMWSLAPLTAFYAQFKQGVGIQSLATFLFGFAPLLIFIGSFFNKKAYWKIRIFDLGCGFLSILGLVLWYVTKQPNIAIVLSIISDFAASLPTISKSWKHPETENYKEFLFSSVNGGVNLLTLKIWDFAHYSFSLYIFILCALLTILIKFKPGKIYNK